MSKDTATIYAIAASRLRKIPLEMWQTLLATLGAEGLMRMDAGEIVRSCGGVKGLAETLEERNKYMELARDEYKFVSKHGVKCLSPADSAYPERLRSIPDAPRMLYVLGDGDPDAERMLAVVGTRRPSAYGTHATMEIVKQLAEKVNPVTIVSGLAFGIDAAAHRAAMDAGQPTIAVVAHGLGMVYPAGHRDLAAQMLKSGGAIATEYLHSTKPYRGQFLERNRIVAAMTDASLVVESPIKGGALNTAAQAADYGRRVLALPGRITDEVSQGCLRLIATDRAALCMGADSLCEQVGWQTAGTTGEQAPTTPALPGIYAGDENMQQIIATLKESLAPLHIDIVASRTGLPMHELTVLLSELEFEGIVMRQPGNRFSIV